MNPIERQSENRMDRTTEIRAAREQTMRKPTESIDRTRLMRRALVWAAQIGLFALSAEAAFLVRFDFSLPSAYLRALGFALPVWLVAKVIVFRLAKLDRGLWRYVSAADLVRLAIANLAASAVGCVVILAFGPAGFPRSIYLLDLMICFLLTSGSEAGGTIWPGSYVGPVAEPGNREADADLRLGRRGHDAAARDSQQPPAGLPGGGICGRS